MPAVGSFKGAVGDLLRLAASAVPKAAAAGKRVIASADDGAGSRRPRAVIRGFDQ